MSGTYLYQINQVVNIDNNTKNVVFGTDPTKVYKNLIDTNVDPLVRVIGGAWSDDVYVHNIYAHPTDENSEYTSITNNELNIASDGNIVTMKGKTVQITSDEADSSTTIYGKTLNIGETVSDTILHSCNLTLSTTGQNSTTTIYGKTLTIGENVSDTTIKSNTLTLTTESQLGSTTTINGKTLTIGENDSATTFKSNTLTLTTANQNSITTINGKTLTMGENSREGTVATLYSKQISIGDDTNTTNLNLTGNNVAIDADTILTATTDLFKLNEPADGAFVKIEKNKTDNKAQIDVGDLTNTEDINIKGQNIDIHGDKKLILQTEVFEFNKDSQKAYFEVNDKDSRITIGRENLDNTIIHGSNVYIGEPGCTTTIYGKLIAYQEGSNIITNTVVDETSAFHVHNTGTTTALTVIQDNSTSGGISASGKNLAEFYTAANQNRTPLRIDAVGRIGMGVLTDNNLKAWLHINRNDPDISSLNYDDLLIVEDEDADQTPFIIKKEGDVGIGTNQPRYKLDVWTKGSILNGQGDTIRSKGIALRDVVYVKQNHTNRILFALGNKLYDHTVGAPVDVFKTGYTFSYDTSDQEFANSDNVADPYSNPSDGTFIFRMTCKMHIAGDDGNMAYRRFEIFVNPQNSTFNEKQFPAHVVVADIFDSTHDFYIFPNNPQVVKDGLNWRLEIPWKLNEQHPNAQNFTYPSSSRVYLDVEFFGHESIGDIKAEPIHYKNDSALP